MIPGALAWPYTVDDAFVLGRYARNLAEGAGYAMNPGRPSDGVTGPLGLLPGWIGASLGVDAVQSAKAAGLLAAALAFGMAIARLRARAGGRRPAVLAVAIAAGLLGPTLAVWGQAGLETGLAALAFTTAALAATSRRGRRGPRIGIAALALACLPWLRPELVPAAAVVAVVALRGSLRAAPERKLRARLRAGLPLLGLLLGLGGVALFRLLLFGHPMPVSALAKPPLPQNGLPYVLRALLLFVGPFGAILIGWAAKEGRRLRPIAAILGAHLLAVILAGGDWMPGFRLMTPLVPLLGLGLGLAFAEARLRLRRPWAIGLALLVIAPWGIDAALQWPPLRASAEARRGSGREIAAALRPYPRVAMVDIGYLAYASGVQVIDLGGITDDEIARLPGGHLDKAIPVELLMGRDPSALLLHASLPPRIREGRLATLAGYPVERHLARMPWVRERFRVRRIFPYAPGYLYILLTPASPEERRAGSEERDSVGADDPDHQAQGDQP